MKRYVTKLLRLLFNVDALVQLRNSVTTIIHNAWRLDFNLGLTSFEPNIQGTRNLIDMARLSPYGPSVKILFTSSVSSAFSWDKTQGPYPEEVVVDPKYAVGNGYGESKYVSERVCGRNPSLRIAFQPGPSLSRYLDKAGYKQPRSGLAR